MASELLPVVEYAVVESVGVAVRSGTAEKDLARVLERELYRRAVIHQCAAQYLVESG
jgi:hypothetical protein